MTDKEVWFGPATDDVWGIHLGQTVLHNVHPREVCEEDGFPCCLHSPSNHHMREWPTLWRADRRLMERTCPEHGIGHPDPDDLAFHRRNGRAWQGVHGCCGCCRPAGQELPDLCGECGGDGYVTESDHDERCKAQWGGPCDGLCPVPVQSPCPACS